MSNLIDGFQPLPWSELRTRLLALPYLPSDFNLSGCERITDNAHFIQSHISMIDAAPPNKKGLTTQEARRRKVIAPYYERILKYYYLRIQLIEA